MQTNKAYNIDKAISLRVVRKTCLACDKIITGRSDKKFCDQKCRSAYSNSLNSTANNQVRKIRNALNKNRRILQAYVVGKENAKVLKDDLFVDGFTFKYHTHTKPNSKGQVYYYCYEFGYLQLEGNMFLIVRDK